MTDINLNQPPAPNEDANKTPSEDEGSYPKGEDVKFSSNINDPEGPDYVGEPAVIEVEFTYPTHADPMRLVDGHDHGIYLDDEMRRAGEIQRAKIEGRKPDLKNPPAVQGTPLIPTSQVRKYRPGDVEVTADVIQEVVVGVNEENLAGHGDAIHAREVEAAYAERDAS